MSDDERKENAASRDSETFGKILGNKLITYQKLLLPCAVLALVFHIGCIVTDPHAPPSWVGFVPCMLKSGDVFDSISQASRVLKQIETYLALVPPVLCCVVICWNFARGTVRILARFHYWVFFAAFVFKVAMAVALYGSTNARLITDFSPVVAKSCEVVLALTFYPPGYDDPLIGGQVTLLRNTSAAYFANPVNWVAPQYTGLEATLAGLDEPFDPTWVDDSVGCNSKLSESESYSYQILERYPSPSPSIVQYCAEAAQLVQQGKEDAAWPIATVLQHLENVLAALTLMRPSCQPLRPDATQMAIIPGLGVADICDYYTTASSWFDIPEDHRWYIGHFQIMGTKEINHSDEPDALFQVVRQKMLNLPSDFHRKATCAFILQVIDPETGYQFRASSMCPEVVADFEASPQRRASYAEQDGYGSSNAAAGRTYTSVFPGLTPEQPTKIIKAVRESIDKSAPGGGFLSHAAPFIYPSIARYVLKDPAEMMKVNALASKGFINGFNEERTGSITDMLTELGEDPSAAILQADQMANDFIDIELEQAVDATTMAGYLFVTQYAERVGAAAQAAVLTAQTAIGLFTGVQASISLFPFTISTMTGIMKGVSLFRNIAMKADTSDSDDKVIHSYSVLLIVSITAIMWIPLIVIPIFIFQMLTSYYFALAILGLTMAMGGYIWLMLQPDVASWGSVCTAFLFSSGGNPWKRGGASLLMAVGWSLVVVGVGLEAAESSSGAPFWREVSTARVYLASTQLAGRLIANVLFTMYLAAIVTLTTATFATQHLFRNLKNVVYVRAKADPEADVGEAIRAHGGWERFAAANEVLVEPSTLGTLIEQPRDGLASTSSRKGGVHPAALG